MIVRSFLSWYDSAPMSERIEAVRMMVQCTLAGELGSDSQQEAVSALTIVLDDPAISVRAALAWELALADNAPRHLVLGLAHDQPEVAALVLARSPHLKDADLIACARHGEALTHLAIVSRNHVAPAVCMALAETAGAKALAAMLRNPGAIVEDAALRVVFERHQADPVMREALHQRDDLPADVRQSLITAVSRDLLGFVQQRGWLGERRAARTINDAREGALITLASEADDLARFIAQLAGSGQLTPSLLIRSLLTGDTSLFGAALVCLADVSPSRVAGMLRGKAGSALAATCVRAGLPRALVPVFTAALTAIADMPRDFMADGQTLHRPIINRVLAACLVEDAAELEPVIAALRRLDADLSRAEARSAIEKLKAVEPTVLIADVQDAPLVMIAETPVLADESVPADLYEAPAYADLTPAEADMPVVIEAAALPAPLYDAPVFEAPVAEAPVVEVPVFEVPAYAAPAIAVSLAEMPAPAMVATYLPALPTPVRFSFFPQKSTLDISMQAMPEPDAPVLQPVIIDNWSRDFDEKQRAADAIAAVAAPVAETREAAPIYRQPPVMRVHDDLEALLEQLYAEERALSQALHVVDERAPMDQTYFAPAHAPQRRAA